MRPGTPSSAASASSAASTGTPVATARPSAASAFIAWNAPISGRISVRAGPSAATVDALARALGPRRDEAQIGVGGRAEADDALAAVAAERRERASFGAVDIDAPPCRPRGSSSAKRRRFAAK